MVGKLVDHAYFGEAKRTVQVALLQHTDQPRVEAAEAAHGCNPLIELLVSCTSYASCVFHGNLRRNVAVYGCHPKLFTCRCQVLLWPILHSRVHADVELAHPGFW